MKVLRVGLGDKLGLKSDGDTQCLSDLVGEGDDGAEAIDIFKCRGSYKFDLPYSPLGCLLNWPSSVYKIVINILYYILFIDIILYYKHYNYTLFRIKVY